MAIPLLAVLRDGVYKITCLLFLWGAFLTGVADVMAAVLISNDPRHRLVSGSKFVRSAAVVWFAATLVVWVASMIFL